jgi:hypothetical protein
VPIITRERRRRGITFLASLRRRLQHLSPYLSVAILLTPLLFVEPLKIVALFVAGKGHWLAGCVMLLGAYSVSLFFIERLFRVVKPKLMMLRWFAVTWRRFAALRDNGLRWVFGRLAACWRYAVGATVWLFFDPAFRQHSRNNLPACWIHLFCRNTPRGA